MFEIDASFRPAAATLALLTAFLLLRDARFEFRARLGALFGIGTAAYMFCSGAPEVWRASSLLLPLCIGNSVFFWWFVLAPTLLSTARLGRRSLSFITSSF